MQSVWHIVLSFVEPSSFIAAYIAHRAQNNNIECYWSPSPKLPNVHVCIGHKFGKDIKHLIVNECSIPTFNGLNKIELLYINIGCKIAVPFIKCIKCAFSCAEFVGRTTLIDCEVLSDLTINSVRCVRKVSGARTIINMNRSRFSVISAGSALSSMIDVVLPPMYFDIVTVRAEYLKCDGASVGLLKFIGGKLSSGHINANTIELTRVTISNQTICAATKVILESVKCDSVHNIKFPNVTHLVLNKTNIKLGLTLPSRLVEFAVRDQEYLTPVIANSVLLYNAKANIRQCRQFIASNCDKLTIPIGTKYCKLIDMCIPYTIYGTFIEFSAVNCTIYSLSIESHTVELIRTKVHEKIPNLSAQMISVYNSSLYMVDQPSMHIFNGAMSPPTSDVLFMLNNAIVV